MGHIGRTYPYFPDYWATECLFWPGFAPWKLALPNQFIAGAPWNLISGKGLLISNGGEVVDDRTQISWTFHPIPGEPLLTLVVSLEQEELVDAKYAVWVALLKLGLFDIGTLWYFQPSPQYTCAVPLSPWWDVHDPAAMPTGPSMDMRPATYAEGGSPF